MKILIPLDGSKFAEEVLGPAVRLATDLGAEVHLMEVIKESKLQATWSRGPSAPATLQERPAWWRREMPGWEVPEVAGVPAETRGQAIERVHCIADDYLAHVASEFFPQGAQKASVIADDPAEAIVDYAQDHEVDLIAMATHGRTGFARLLMGSVANKLVRSGVAPVYLVRPGKLHDEEEEETHQD